MSLTKFADSNLKTRFVKEVLQKSYVPILNTKENLGSTYRTIDKYSEPHETFDDSWVGKNVIVENKTTSIRKYGEVISYESSIDEGFKAIIETEDSTIEITNDNISDYSLSYLRPATVLVNSIKYWGKYTIGQTSNGRILKTNRRYQTSSIRIVTIPENGVIFPSADVPTEGNIPPIDISLYKSIHIECDGNYKFTATVFQDPSSTNAFKSISGWTTEPVEYEIETGDKWMTVLFAKIDDTTISKEEFTHCLILGMQ